MCIVLTYATVLHDPMCVNQTRNYERFVLESVDLNSGKLSKPKRDKERTRSKNMTIYQATWFTQHDPR